jgi:hypothetical protein
MKRRPARIALKAAAGLAVILPFISPGIRVLSQAALPGIPVVAGLCWIIADPDRTQRLAMLIRAVRGSDRQIAPGADRDPRPAAGSTSDAA